MSNEAPARRLRVAATLLLVTLFAVGLWTSWAEVNTERERQLRIELQEQLQQRFPDSMRPEPGRYGLFHLNPDANAERGLRIVLVHGLDEPGGIWVDLLPALSAGGFDTWEFRYPNDQAIDRSTDLLAEHWQALPQGDPVVLIGHSMGGLVIRDFVTRWRYPASTDDAVGGAAVLGVILVGTPNHGSDWARLRVLLEVRDLWAVALDSGFSPFAGWRDGTGAAKIDLQPGSVFLTDLNGRPWPAAVAIRIIGGTLLAAAPALGDGVVAVESLPLSGAPPPVLLEASHRGLLARLLDSGEDPPAIPVIMDQLAELAPAAADAASR